MQRRHQPEPQATCLQGTGQSDERIRRVSLPAVPDEDRVFRAQVLPGEDQDAANVLERALEKRGMEIMSEARAESALCDDDGVVVSESGAILLYLARKSGKLMPRDLAGEAQVLRWSFTALTTLELPALSLFLVG